MTVYRDVVHTDLGPAFVDGDGPPTDRDMREVRDFQRFLRAVGPADDPKSNTRGWHPYAVGWPAPPEGCDDLPLTAWTMPC